MHDIRASTSIIGSHNLSSKSTIGVCCIERLCGVGMDANIAIGCTGGLLNVLSLRTLSVIAAGTVHQDDIRALASTTSQGTSKDTSSLESIHLTTSSYDAMGKVWNLQRNRNGPLELHNCAILRGHEGKVLSLSGVPGQSALLSSGADGRVYLWEHPSIAKY